MWVKSNKPEMAPTKVPTALDIAWAAGVYEGEGSCRLCGKTKRGFMSATVQKDPEILYRLRDWFGGRVNVRDRGTDFSQYVWDVCGDHGRIFMALIYEYMSARRKTQIDASAALLFLEEKSPVGLNIAQLRSTLDEYYAENSRKQRSHSLEQRKQKYQEDYADLEKRKLINERNRQAREAMTQEQKEASQKYQQEYYKRKKAQQKAQVISIRKTA